MSDVHGTAPPKLANADFRALVEGLPEPLAVVVDGTWAFLNPAAVRLLGAPGPEALLGRPVAERIHPEDLPAIEERMRRAVATGAPNPPLEQRVLRLDGEVVEIETVSFPIELDGRPAVQVVARDVTERRRAERALRESEERFAKAFRTSPSSITISRLDDGRVVEANPGFLRLTGYAREEVLGRGVRELGWWPDAAERERYVDRLLADGSVRGMLTQYRRRGGDLRFARVDAELLEFGGERCILAVAEDVTERRRAEAVQEATYRISEAAHSAHTLEELYPAIHRAVAGLMPASNFYIALYDAASGMLEYAYFVDELEPPPPPKPLEKGLTEHVLRTGRPILASPEVFGALIDSGEVELIGPMSVDWLGVPLRVDEETIGVLVVQSYTEGVRFSPGDLEILQFVSSQVAMSIVRKRGEERLRESEARYRTLVTGAPEAILVYDPERRRFVDWNDRAVAIFGRHPDALRRCDWADLSAPERADAVEREVRAAIAAALAGEQPVFEWTVRRGRDEDVLCEVRLVPLSTAQGPRVRASITDISERRRREDLLGTVAEAVSAATGEAFFRSLVEHLARTLGVRFAFIGQVIAGEARVRTIAVSAHGAIVENFEYDLAGTPCENVVGHETCIYAAGVRERFPDDQLLASMAVESYLGMPLFDHLGAPLGILVVMDGAPLREAALAEALLRIFAARAAAELERMRSEDALRASEERYRAFIEQSSEAIWCVELRQPMPIDRPEEEQIDGFFEDGYLLECNAAFAQMYGFARPEALAGLPLASLLVSDDAHNRDYLRSFVRAGYRLTDAESHEVDRDGHPKVFLNNLVGVIEDGRLLRAWGTQRDVTERRRAEAVLHQQAAAMRASMDGMAVFDADGDLVFANDAYAKICGMAPDALVGRGLEVTFAPAERGRLQREILPILWETGEWRGETVGERVDGAWFPQEVSLNRIEGGGLVCVVRDISARVAAEEALRQSEEQFRSLFEQVGDAVYVETPDGRLRDINPAGVALFGYSSRGELLEVDVARELFADPAERERSLALLRERGFVKDLELTLKRKDGQRLTVLETATAVRDEAGTVMAYRGILRDVSERRQLEEQLRQAQKMEAVGRLAGGVAHDFNNLLTAITGYSDLLLARVAPDAPMRREVEEIKRAGARAAELTRQLLAFSRRQVLSSRVMSLNRVVTDIEKLLRRVIGEDVQLVTDLDPELGAVRADPGQMEQVIMNLAVNARDAMPHGGRLVLRTANVVLDERYSRRHLHVRPGEYVLLAVSDSGEGMPREVREHIFEPFFTTKEVGRGTGLGLSMVYGIVRQSEGHIEVDSEPGSGTTFRIYLPRIRQQVEGAPPSLGPAGAPRGHETVLVVEDEPAVQNLVRRILEERGYRVQVANDADAALASTDGLAGLDLLLTDVVMPGRSGPELAAELHRRWPDLRVLYMSGYSESFVGRQGLVPNARFLQKPFTPEALAHKVREVLDERR